MLEPVLLALGSLNACLAVVVRVDPVPVMDISCPSLALCVGVDEFRGAVFVSSRVAGGRSAWHLVSNEDVAYVSCGSVNLCVAASDTGKLLVSTTPAGGASAWKEQNVNFGFDCTLGDCLPAGGTFWGVSCAKTGAGFCVAVGDGNLAASSNPTGGTNAWPLTVVDAGHSFTAVSCTTGGLCVAVDDAGNVASSTTPTGGARAWHVQNVDRRRRLSDISCASRRLCVAADQLGNVLTSTHPDARAPTWRLVHVDRYGLSSVSCPSVHNCVAVDTRGRALTATA